jgi:hypothetical protein
MKRIVLIDDLVEDGVERPRLNISWRALVARIRRSHSSLAFVAIRTFECPKVLERVAR